MSFLGMDPSGARGLATTVSGWGSAIDSIVALIAAAEALSDLPTNTQVPLLGLAGEGRMMAGALESAADEIEAFKIQAILAGTGGPDSPAVAVARAELARLSAMAEEGKISDNDPRIDDAARVLRQAAAAQAALAQAAADETLHWTTGDRWSEMLSLTEAERLAILEQWRSETGQQAMTNLIGFTQWEIASGRISDDAGSEWWELMNGALAVDVRDALALAAAGETVADNTNVQNWLDLYYMDDLLTEGFAGTFMRPGQQLFAEAINIGDPVYTEQFWKAHQYSLWSAEGYAAANYLQAETPAEQELIAVIMENVNWTAAQNFDPTLAYGNGVGLFINDVLDYPTYYPFEGDASTVSADSVSEILEALFS